MAWPRSKASLQKAVVIQWPVVVVFLLVAVLPGLAQDLPISTLPASKLVERGRDLLRKRNLQQARRFLEEAVAREPKSPEAWTLLADSYSQLGLEDKAIRGYQTVLELRPESPDALYNLGILHLKRQRFEDAVRYLQAFRRQRPRDEGVLLPLAGCLLRMGRYQEGIPLLEEAIRGPKAEKSAFRSLASAYSASSQNDRALEVLLKARDLWPDDQEIRLALVSELMLQEDPARTLTRLTGREIKRLLPEDLELLASGYVVMGRLEEARRYAERAVAEGGGEPALLALANVLQLEGRHTEVIELLEPHKSKLSTSAKFMFTLGLSYYNNSSYSLAGELFDRAASLDPSLAQAHYFKGNTLARLGKPDLALAAYEEAVRLAPGKFLYHLHFGLVLSTLGEKDRAEEHLKRAVELNGRDAQARYELARIYYENSRDIAAREQLEEAIKADGNYEPSFYLLSQVYERLGRHEDAMQMLKQFQAIKRQRHEEQRELIQGSLKGRNP